MMEQGQLIASEVLPKVGDEFRKAARDGGAYKKALEGLRATEGQFSTEVQRSADTIFKSGFEKGLSQLYKELSTQLKGTTASQKDLGNIYNKFFKLITLGIKVVTPLLETLIRVSAKVVDGWYEIFTAGGRVLDTLGEMNPKFREAAQGVLFLGLAFKSLYGKIILAVGAIEELMSLFDDKLLGRLETSLGKQINFATMTQQNIELRDDGKYYAKGEKSGLGFNAKDLESLSKDPLAVGAAAAGIMLVYGVLKKILGVVTAISTGAGLKKAAKYVPDRVNNVGKGVGIGSFVNPVTAAATTLAAPIVYSAARMSQNPSQALEDVKSSGMYSGRLQMAERMSNELQQRQMSSQGINQTINLSGFEIPITITNPSDLDEARRAGQAASEAFSSTLEDRLSSLLKGGR